MTWPRPPKDHGSDRHGYYEVNAPDGVQPPRSVLDAFAGTSCPDCLANVFLAYVDGPPERAMSWRTTVAHDDGCPSFAEQELTQEGTFHVVPNNDLVDHELSERCICGPTTTPVRRDDGSMAWMYVHQALDGRE